ncbi:hypothetical protein [Alsobacter metallidurans]|nr:hypothetical protein [Alsobacter metallidurans]
MAGQADLPAHWVTDANEPVQFTVDFIVGEAEVEDELGRYMVAHKLAKRTKLLLPST